MIGTRLGGGAGSSSPEVSSYELVRGSRLGRLDEGSQ